MMCAGGPVDPASGDLQHSGGTGDDLTDDAIEDLKLNSEATLNAALNGSKPGDAKTVGLAAEGSAGSSNPRPTISVAPGAPDDQSKQSNVSVGLNDKVSAEGLSGASKGKRTPIVKTEPLSINGVEKMLSSDEE